MKQKISAQEFYQLVRSKDQTEINRISGSYIKKMAGYLRIVQGADEEMAADCAQQAFENVLIKMKEGSLENVENIYSYLIITAKNEYLKLRRRKNLELPHEPHQLQRMEGDIAADVVEGLDLSDKEKVLKICVENMRKERRNFYWRVINYITEDDEVAAEKLNMRPGSYRTRKSRLIEGLRKCVEKMGF